MYYYSIVKNCFTPLKMPRAPPVPHHHPPPQSLVFLISLYLRLLQNILVGITQYIAFTDWLL